MTTRALRLATLAAVAGLALVSRVASAGSSEPLTILTWNVWHGTVRTERGESLRFPGESGTERRRRLAYQLELLREHRPDLILLQEVPRLPHTFRRLSHGLGYRQVHKVDSCGLRRLGLGIPTNAWNGLAILARPGLDLRGRGSARLSGRWSFCSDWFGLQLEEGRYTLLAEITTPAGERLLVVNTHLHAEARMSDELEGLLDERVATGRMAAGELARVRGAVERSRQRKAAEIETLLASIDRRRGFEPELAGIILGGDLNLVPGSAGYRRLVASGLADAARAPGSPSDAPATYDPERNPLAARVGEVSAPTIPVSGDPDLVDLARRHRERSPRRIDYVFLSAPLAERVTVVELFGVEPFSHESSWPPMASDHFGVLVRLAPPKRPAGGE